MRSAQAGLSAGLPETGGSALRAALVSAVGEPFDSGVEFERQQPGGERPGAGFPAVEPAGKHLGTIHAAHLKVAHEELESGQSIGKIVLEGFSN